MATEYKNISIPATTAAKLEAVRRAKGARSLAAVVTELTDKAHARMKANVPEVSA